MAVSDEQRPRQRSAKPLRMRPPAISVPARALRAAAQRLVVTADTDKVSVGQARRDLEKRLGLKSGSFSSRKRARREVNFAFQLEMAKKQLRSEDSELVCRALVAHEGYPDRDRQMLIDALAHVCLTADESSDPERQRQAISQHQLRFLSIAKDALLDGQQDVAQRKMVLVNEHCQALQNESQTRARATGLLAEAESMAEQSAGTCRCAYQAAVDSVVAAQADHEQAKAGRAEAKEQAVRLEASKAPAITCLKGPLAVLIDGTWCGDEAWRKAIDELINYLRSSTSVEDTLLESLPSALRHRPQSRKRFDHLAAECAQKAVQNQIAAIDKEIHTLSSVEADAPLLATEAMVFSAKNHAATSQSKLQEAEIALNKARAERADETQRADEFAEMVQKAAAGVSRLERQEAELQIGLAALHRMCGLEAGGSSGCQSPDPKRERKDVLCVSPRPVASPFRTRVLRMPSSAPKANLAMSMELVTPRTRGDAALPVCHSEIKMASHASGDATNLETSTEKLVTSTST